MKNVNRVLWIDQRAGQTLFILTEDGNPVEAFLDTPGENAAGDILLGRVMQVQKGLGAAFVQIGEEGNAFLPMDELPELPVRAGQEVIVQVKRRFQGDKNTRITRKVSLPGELLTLLAIEPGFLGVSQKIRDAKKRAFLRDIVRAQKLEEVGWIIRTAAQDAGEAEIAAEARRLFAEWRGIEQQAQYLPAPYSLRRTGGGWGEAAAMCAGLAIHEVIVADVELLPQAKALRRNAQIDPSGFGGIYTRLRKALRRKVAMKSGATLVIDPCEALTVIDVNAAKAQTKGDIEATARMVNLTACEEIARQMRLRDLRGIIVIDFIDMKSPECRKEIWEALQSALQGDRGKPDLVDFSRLCLLQLTRKACHTQANPALMSLLEEKKGPL